MHNLFKVIVVSAFLVVLTAGPVMARSTIPIERAWNVFEITEQPMTIVWFVDGELQEAIDIVFMQEDPNYKAVETSQIDIAIEMRTPENPSTTVVYMYVNRPVGADPRLIHPLPGAFVIFDFSAFRLGETARFTFPLGDMLVKQGQNKPTELSFTFVARSLYEGVGFTRVLLENIEITHTRSIF